MAGVLSLVTATMISGGATGARAETLEQALAGLLQSSDRVTAAQLNLQANTEGIDEALSAYYPKAAITGDVGYEYTDSPSLRDDGDSPFSTDREGVALTVTQNVWDGWRREATVDVARLNEQVAGLSLGATVQDVLFEAITAYHEVLRQTRLIEIAKSDEENLQIQLQLEDERVQRGSGITVDVLQAKSRLQLAKERRVALEGRLRQAVARYQQVYSTAPDVASLVDPVPPIALLPADMEMAVSLAQDDNPALNASARGIDIASQERIAARSDFFPRLDLVGSAGYDNDVDGVEGYRENYSIVLRVTWEFFSGFATQSRVKRAGAVYSQRMSEYNDAGRRVAEEVRLAWENLETSKERVELLQNAVNIAEEVYAARQRLREAGQESSINVLDSLSELKTAQINFVDASYNARLSVYRVLRAVGHLRPQDMGLSEPELTTVQ
ncbi:TolC family outer membrane protein [Dongia sp.]|uniref:TolC family outer membrane protein n=1 Tax=Dongia sp. TaxID=1977262 RepID=UPI0035AF3DCC